jgi:hypothetical protein
VAKVLNSPRLKPSLSAVINPCYNLAVRDPKSTINELTKFALAGQPTLSELKTGSTFTGVRFGARLGWGKSGGIPMADLLLKRGRRSKKSRKGHRGKHRKM